MRTGALALLIPALVAAQNPPSFRTETRLEQVSVVVHDKNGPVANLTKDDFSLTDRGQPRHLAIFSVSSTPATAPSSAAALPTNTFSNRPRLISNPASPNGVTIILLDGMNTLNYDRNPLDKFMDTLRTDNLSLAFARAQVIKFVKAIEPGDRVAIYALGATLHVLCDFTNDSVELQRILQSYRPTPSADGNAADPQASDLPTTPNFNPAIDAGNVQEAVTVNATRADATLDALLAIAGHVSGIPGRKNLVWLTADVPLPGDTVARIASRVNLAIYPVDARGLATAYNSVFSYREPFVSGKAISIPAGTDFAMNQGEMFDAALQTGGVASVNNNNLSGAIRKAIDDAAVTYTLGFYVDQKSLDGKFHELKIRVKTPGLDVRYPRGYFASLRPLASERANNLERMILSPLESAEIHLLARVERTPEPSLNLSGSIDLRDLELHAQGDALTGAVELYLVQQNQTGEVLAKDREKLDLRLTRSEYASYLKTGLFFRKIVSAKPKAATLRIVVGDPATAKMGSLIIPIAELH